MEADQALNGVPSPSGRARVLVVDQDPAIRLICSAWLSLDGYDVLEAANGQEALQLALAEAPAAVLLDLSLPVLDGFGVAAALRADERTSGVPVVVLTAETGPAIAEQVSALGAAGHFTKPFDPGVVAAFVKSVADEFTAGRSRTPAGGHAF